MRRVFTVIVRSLRTSFCCPGFLAVVGVFGMVMAPSVETMWPLLRGLYVLNASNRASLSSSVLFSHATLEIWNCFISMMNSKLPCPQRARFTSFACNSAMPCSFLTRSGSFCFSQCVATLMRWFMDSQLLFSPLKGNAAGFFPRSNDKILNGGHEAITHVVEQLRILQSVENFFLCLVVLVTRF